MPLIMSRGCMSNELTQYDRERLQYWLRSKQSLRAIARVMRKDHSVIVREIQRNGGNRTRYRADVAERRAVAQRHVRRRGKLATHPELTTYIVDRLKNDWSPEEIAGRLQATGATATHGVTISPESIYQYIYDRAHRKERLFQYLPQRRTRRRQRGGRKTRNLPIPGRVSLQWRPREVDERSRIGDWESDNLEFKRTVTTGAVSVQCERAIGLLRIHKVARKKSPADTLTALLATKESLPQGGMRTVTFDNGTENARHTVLRDVYGISTYFCAPFASWQKGSVENANKLLRRYLPRETLLDTITDDDLEVIQERLNNRPRKRLGYKTPNEMLITSIQSGALLT